MTCPTANVTRRFAFSRPARRCQVPPPANWNAVRGGVALCIAALVLLLGGCGARLNTRYGRTSGMGLSSVNGTRVLADMFVDRGHKVESWYRLSPKLLEADVIVWFPDDFEGPSEEVQAWLDAWLRGGSKRTLIYVGRDFDAAPGYWEKMATRVAAGQLPLVTRNKEADEKEFQTERAEMPATSQCEWFGITRELDHQLPHALSGPWAQGIDPARVEIELNGRLTPVDWAQSLLESHQDVLVARLPVENSPGSQLISVANGSFLLNLPLVNHEHRKLAGRLVSAVGPPRKRVAFLQSGAGGPEILDKEPEPPEFNALDILGVWPLGGVLLHLAALGIIFAFARWPIFGRPLVPPAPPASDFGKHVTALGQLLARTRDRDYAHARLAQWREGKKGKNSERGTGLS